MMMNTRLARGSGFMHGFAKAGILATLALGLSVTAAAQEQLLTNRATEMRAAPDETSALVKSLPEKSAVEQLERKGAWTRVQIAAPNGTKTANKTTETGWVRMMHLRGGVIVVESRAASNSSFFSGLSRMFGGGPSRANTQAQSATIGIRGLSPEELKTASPDAAALAKMNSFKSDKAEAERYAREAKLAQANVPELDNIGSQK